VLSTSLVDGVRSARLTTGATAGASLAGAAWAADDGVRGVTAVEDLGAVCSRPVLSLAGATSRAAERGDSRGVRFGLDSARAALLSARVSRAGWRAAGLSDCGAAASAVAAGAVWGPGWEPSAVATPEETASDRPSAIAVAPTWAAHLNADTTAPPFAIPPMRAQAPLRPNLSVQQLKRQHDHAVRPVFSWSHQLRRGNTICLPPARLDFASRGYGATSRRKRRRKWQLTNRCNSAWWDSAEWGPTWSDG